MSWAWAFEGTDVVTGFTVNELDTILGRRATQADYAPAGCTVDAATSTEIGFTLKVSVEPLAAYHVLVVEDNDINLEIAEFMLKTAGAKVVSARNGEEAIVAFLAKPEGYYDAILMDVMMPVKDGIVATEEIRKLKRADAATVPIIAMTANAFYDDEERMKNAGMNACVTKPLDVNKLIRTIKLAAENDVGGGIW